MTRYRYRWNHKTGESYEVGEDDPRPLARLQIMKSLEPYRSPVTGDVVRSHSERRADLKRHGCIDARDGPSREECANIRERNREESWNTHVRDVAEYFGDR